MKTWDDAQKRCQAWEAICSRRMSLTALSRGTDLLWVGAHESPKAPGINKNSWKWISDGSSVSTATKKEPNNDGGEEEECGFAGIC